MLQTGLPMRCSSPEPGAALVRRTAWLAALAALACGLQSHAGEIAEQLPARLPTDVAPVHYDIHLEPNAAALTFNGRETIDVVVQRETKSIVLNALDLEVSEATLDGGTPAAVTADLAAQTVTDVSGGMHSFDIHPVRKRCLLEGLDDIARTQQYTDRISTFEKRYRAGRPWLSGA